MLLDRTFHSTGQVNGERINGLYNAYTYNASGELETIKGGDNIQMGAFTNYTLGVPRTLSRASSTGTVQKDVTLYGSGKVKTESAWGKPSVKTTFNYDPQTGKVNSITPHTTESSKIHYPKWNPADAALGRYRREYTGVGVGDQYRNVSYFDTLGRPIIQYEQDPTNGDISFIYSRYDANGTIGVPVTTGTQKLRLKKGGYL